MSERSGLLGPEAIRERELTRALVVLVRVRGVVMSAAILVFSGLALSRGEAWMWAAVAALAPLVVVDVARLLRGRGTPLVRAPLDLAFGVLMQTVVITLTGGLESPLVVIYVPLALMVGATLGPRRSGTGVVLGIFAALWGMLLAGRAGLVPRAVPVWLGLDAGFGGTGYAVAKAIVLSFVVLVASRLGVVLSGTIDRMLTSAVGARDEALEALGAQNRELVQLSRAIAHELKNPLASVHGLVQLLERGGQNSERRFEVLKQEIARMRTILDELLEFSRPLGELRLEEVDVARLLEELTVIHEGVAAARNVTIRLPDSRSETIRADVKKLKQALVNLLQNALDACPPGGVVTWIVRRDGDSAVLGVLDSGPGFSPEGIASASNGQLGTTKPHGHGIGLRVVRGIARQHGGRLELDNAPGGGARVWITLPVKTIEAGAVAREEVST